MTKPGLKSTYNIAISWPDLPDEPEGICTADRTWISLKNGPGHRRVKRPKDLQQDNSIRSLKLVFP